MAVDNAVDGPTLAFELAVMLPGRIVEGHLFPVQIPADGAFHLRAEKSVFAGKTCRESIKSFQFVREFESRLGIASKISPCMDVSLFSGIGTFSKVRGGGHVGNQRAIVLDRAGLDVVENLIAPVAFGLQHSREPVCVGLGDFVVSGPDCHTGIMCQTLGLIFCLAFSFVKERILLVGIKSTCVHKIVHQ